MPQPLMIMAVLLWICACTSRCDLEIPLLTDDRGDSALKNVANVEKMNLLQKTLSAAAQASSLGQSNSIFPENEREGGILPTSVVSNLFDAGECSQDSDRQVSNGLIDGLGRAGTCGLKSLMDQVSDPALLAMDQVNDPTKSSAEQSTETIQSAPFQQADTTLPSMEQVDDGSQPDDNRSKSEGWGLGIPPGIVPELPLPVLTFLLPSLPLLPVDILAQLPSSVLNRLPPETLSQLPIGILSGLPKDTLSQLPVPVLSTLPASALTKLPGSVLSQLPVKTVSTLPTNDLARLPLSKLAMLPQTVLLRMVQDILSQVPFPLTVLYQLASIKKFATPNTINSLLSIIDLFKKISATDSDT